MDATADDEDTDELLDLARQLRSQLLRHAAQGTWAAPGAPSARVVLEDEAAEPVQAESAEAPDGPSSMLGAAAHAAERAVATHVGERAAPPHAGDRPAAMRVALGGDRGASTHVGERTAPFHAEELPATRDTSVEFAERGAPSGRNAPADPGELFAPPVEAPPVEAPPVEAPIVLGRRTLAQVRADLGDCTRCKLHTTRKSIVFGVGAADTPLMFCGEAPGEQEDRRGEPFVGPAGQLLDKMIEAMGWTRATVYIANTTKCRPPGNRNPQPDELSQCMPFLHGQIAAIAPRIIVALGRPAANQLLGTDAPISSLRGKFHPYAHATRDGVSLKIMPTFHPAYLLRDPSKKAQAWADLKLVMAELARLGIAAPRPAAPQASE